MYVPRKKPGKKYITMHIVSTYEAVKSIEIILSILSFFKSSKFSTVFYIAFIHKKNYQLFFLKVQVIMIKCVQLDSKSKNTILDY